MLYYSRPVAVFQSAPAPDELQAYRDKHVVLLNEVTSNGMQSTTKDCPQQQVQQALESQGVEQNPIKGQHQTPVDDISQPNRLWPDDQWPDAIH